MNYFVCVNIILYGFGCLFETGLQEVSQYGEWHVRRWEKVLYCLFVFLAFCTVSQTILKG